MDSMRRIAVYRTDPRVAVPTTEARRLTSGPILTELVGDMERRIFGGGLVPKMTSYSSHSTAVAALLGTLDIFEARHAPEASVVAVELHRFRGNNHVVRIFFRNETNSPPYELELPKCRYPCTFANFKTTVSPYLLSDEEWWWECRRGVGRSARGEIYHNSISSDQNPSLV
ncbi:testicular acid phosphatase homolog [Folsomia candida]|nr:testicular acid phosphatase homolog [Folsomia candida]